jgi:hypothetical protein
VGGLNSARLEPPTHLGSVVQNGQLLGAKATVKTITTCTTAAGAATRLVQKVQQSIAPCTRPTSSTASLLGSKFGHVFFLSAPKLHAQNLYPLGECPLDIVADLHTDRQTGGQGISH